MSHKFHCFRINLHIWNDLRFFLAPLLFSYREIDVTLRPAMMKVKFELEKEGRMERQYREIQNSFSRTYRILVRLVDAVRVFTPGLPQQSRQWFWSAPVAEIRIVKLCMNYTRNRACVTLRHHVSLSRSRYNCPAATCHIYHAQPRGQLKNTLFTYAVAVNPAKIRPLY
jgi:hypothetical protein